MWTLVNTFFDIALHRRGPEDLPASRFLLTAVLVCSAMVGILSLLLTERPLGYALGVVGLYTVLLLVFVAAVVSFFGKSRRFLQTVTAYAGVDTLLSLLGLPLLFFTTQDPQSETPALQDWLYLMLVIWSLEVFSYILSRSLEVAYWIAAVLVVAYFIFSVNLSSLLFGLPT